jgi:hypothetical protein
MKAKTSIVAASQGTAPAKARRAPRSTARPPSNLTFDLSSLGWKAFQDLCGSVLRQVLGQTLVGFAAGRDMGRDWAFQGHWVPAKGETLEGQFVVQCKFHSGGGVLAASEVNDELPKIKMLAGAGLCDVYLLMTNLRVTSAVHANICRAVKKAGSKACLVFGAEQVDTYLREEPRLRALVPRVYGLGDLSEIIDDRAYEQARAVLAAMNEEMRKFVVTGPYVRSIDALNRFGFVLLLGAPAAGKSMIASALAMAAIDQWGLPAIKVDAPDIFRTHWNPHDRHQFFWIDDAFGTTQYQLRLADDWNRILPQLRASIAGGTRVVMTSRDYIWRAASRDLKLTDFEPLETSQVVVDVHELAAIDKQQILYNHLKFGDQPQSFKTAVKPYLAEAVRADPFLPEVARRFGSAKFTQDLGPYRYSVPSFFAHPVDHLRDVITKLDADGRAALAFIYISDAKLQRPVVLDAERAHALAMLGSSLAAVTESLEELRGSLVSLVTDAETGFEHWTFRHPTIGEAFRSIVQHDRQFFPLYLAGMSTYALLGETTCGDRSIEGSVIVEPDDWSIVIRRLVAMDAGYELNQRDTYLVQRSTCEFLRAYTEQHNVTDKDGLVSPRLAARMHECGLLAEAIRLPLVRDLGESLLTELDGSIFERDAASLLTDVERRTLVDRVRDDLLPKIDEVIEGLSSSYDDEEEPGDWLSGVYDTLEALKDEFEQRGDVNSVNVIDDAIVEVGQLEEGLQELYAPTPDWDDERDDFRGWGEASAFDLFADVDA